MSGRSTRQPRWYSRSARYRPQRVVRRRSSCPARRSLWLCSRPYRSLRPETPNPPPCHHEGVRWSGRLLAAPCVTSLVGVQRPLVEADDTEVAHLEGVAQFLQKSGLTARFLQEQINVERTYLLGRDHLDGGDLVPDLGTDG